MTNPNPSPESVKLVASALCRAAGMDPEGGARAGYSWINHETEARAVLATLSQTPPPPSLSTDVQSAATGFHEHDGSLKVAMPGVDEVEATVAETVTVALPVPGAVERAAVVAYIRRQSDRGADLGNEKPKGSRARAAFGGGSLALKRVADNIEAGEHILNDNAPSVALATVAAGDDEGVVDKGNHDCVAKRRPGEPMFILLGRDPDAWQIVRAWASRRLNAGGDPEHCLLGMKTANAMREYAADPANHPASAPDASAYPRLTAIADSGLEVAAAWHDAEYKKATESEKAAQLVGFWDRVAHHQKMAAFHISSAAAIRLLSQGGGK